MDGWMQFQEVRYNMHGENYSRVSWHFGGYFLNYSSLFKHFWLVRQGNMRPRLIGMVTSFPWRYCCCCCCSAQVILPEEKVMADIPPILNSRWISTSLCKRYLALQVMLICRHFRRKRQFSPFLLLRILRDLLLSLSLSLSLWSLELSSSASGDAKLSSEL